MIVLSAEFVKSATAEAEWPPPGPPELAFCGRSNVGKSSCLNTLANRKQLARVSNTPGRTRLLNFFDLVVAHKTRSGTRTGERALRFVDLPGYGFAAGPREERLAWKKMIEQYLTRRETLELLVLLVDGELGPQESDVEMAAWAGTLGKRLLFVATKLDRLPRTRRGAQLDRAAQVLGVPRERLVGFSSTERLGVDELWAALLPAGPRDPAEAAP